ncbi:hypothetical protein CEXT_291741, partial [Caerostris extrusa]
EFQKAGFACKCDQPVKSLEEQARPDVMETHAQNRNEVPAGFSSFGSNGNYTASSNVKSVFHERITDVKYYLDMCQFEDRRRREVYKLRIKE